MKLALVQSRISESREENLDRALGFMDEAAQAGAKMICFPEIQMSPFFPQYGKQDVSAYAVPIDHHIIR